MTPLAIANLARYYTKTNTTTFTNADMLALANAFKDEISSLIVERDAGYFDIPCTFNLIADQRHYALGDNLLNRLHKVEIKFSASDARQPAYFVKDYLGSETESEIVKQFTNAQDGFAYTIRRRALYILSGTITAVTDGVRTWSFIWPADLTDMTANTVSMEVDPSTTTFGFPRQFHELLARKIAIVWKETQPKPVALTKHERSYSFDLEAQLDAISTMDKSAEVIGDTPNAADLGNDGHDY